tara:strand:- start:416329 stop:417825 length:1497 start_codon:yes stop_codon:yes gene_type:complete
MKFVILALLIGLVIGFFVVVWKAARNWRWYNIVAACITMLLAVTMLFPTAGVLQSRAAWHQIKEKLEARAEESEKEQHLIKFGDPSNPTAGEGVVSLSQKLAKLGTEAGRRWRSLRMQNADPQGITLSRPPAKNVGDEPDAPSTLPLIPESMVVFGFAEGQVEGVELPIPMFYLGEFKVTASTPDQVTLTPTGPLEPAQLDAIGQNKAKLWSLYELLPLDGHEPFIAPGSTPDNDNLFGRIDDALVKRSLESAARMMGETGVSPGVQEKLAKEREETLRNYLRDGTQAGPDDPPLSRWVKIEFLKSYEEEVDSDDSRGALEGGFFDGLGRAVDSRLKHGDGESDRAVKFKTGEQVTLKEEKANELIDEGTAKLINRYYVRPLNDYRFVLRDIRLRLTELEKRSRELEFERKVLEDAIAATDKMTTVTQTDKLKLEQDLDQTSKEKVALVDYTEKLKSNVAQTRQNLMRLYQSNQELVEQLRLFHQAIDSRANGLTAIP